METLTKVTCHGILGEKLNNKEWNLAVNSVGEAVRAIEMNSKHKFYPILLDLDKKGLKYRVLINGNDFLCQETPTLEKPESILNSELSIRYNEGALETIDIVPVIEGAGGGSGGILAIIVGVILIIIGAFTSWLGFGAILIAAGVALIAAGVVSLLSKPPKFEDFREIDGTTGRTSYLFQGPQNTTREGGPVPVGYGRLLVGSQVISASYVVKNIDANANIDPGLSGLPGTQDSHFAVPIQPGTDFIFDIGLFDGLILSRYFLGSYVIPGANATIGRQSVVKFTNLGELDVVFTPGAAISLYGDQTFFALSLKTFIGNILCVAAVTTLNGEGLFVGGDFNWSVNIHISSSSTQQFFYSNFLYFNSDGTMAGGTLYDMVSNVSQGWPVQPDKAVRAMYIYKSGLHNNKLLIGGDFDSVNQYLGAIFNQITTFTTRRIARLGTNYDPATTFKTVDPSFIGTQIGKTSNTVGGTIYAIAVKSDNSDPNNEKIYIGGDFKKIGGSSDTRTSLARLNHDGTYDSGFPDLNLKKPDPANINNMIDANVYAIAIDSLGNIFVGGDFTSIKNINDPGGANINANYLVKLDSTGQILKTYNLTAGYDSAVAQNPRVRTIAINANNEIFIGGSFTFREDSGSGWYNDYVNFLKINTLGIRDVGFYMLLLAQYPAVPNIGLLAKKVYSVVLSSSINLIKLDLNNHLVYVGIETYPASYYGSTPIPSPLLKLHDS